jgi:transposase
LAVIASNTLLVKGLAIELKVLNQTIDEYNSEIEKTYLTIPDSKIFDSLPSAGEVSAPRLLAAMGTDRSKFSSAEELACFLGIAPVIERSGNQCWTHTRYKCSKPLKQAFVDWTFLSLRSSYWAEELYKKLRAKGKAHSVAIRAVAFKWVRIIFRCWKDRTAYSEINYLKALRKAGASINPNHLQAAM